MRPIDADALKESLNNKKVVGRFNTIQLIDNAPTIERPHGEWDYEKVAFYGVCSNCGVAVTSNKAEMFLYEEMREFPHNINFCPNCGADMRGDDT